MSSGIDCSTFCQGSGGACECKEFHWRNDGKPIWHECDHGISKHPQGGTTASKSTSTTQQAKLPPPPPLLDPSSLLCASTQIPSATQPTLLDIFSNLTESNLKPGHSSLTQTARARAEAIATFGLQKPKVTALPCMTSGTRKVL